MSTLPVYVFIDNSNVFTGAKHGVAMMENVGTWNSAGSVRQFNNCRVNHGTLVQTVLRGRPAGTATVVVGSRSPRNDALWKTLSDQGFDVTVLDRSTADRGQRVDATITVLAMALLSQQPPGVLLLVVAGDGDYTQLVSQAATMPGWSVEMHSWRASASASSLTPHVHLLDDRYRSFTYAIGPDNTVDRQTLVVSGDRVATMSDDDVMQIVRVMEPPVFGWWSWAGDATLHMYVVAEARDRLCRAMSC